LFDLGEKMGRKGVSKRKKAKQKSAPVLPGSNPSLNGRKLESQPEQVTEKSKASSKDNKKKR
jgi:hypothetical protein